MYMLKYYDGTIFNAPVKTYVNTVNCVGVMGAGIALEFKLRYPEMYDDYVKRCKQEKITVGKPYIYEHSNDIWIMNFPTKNHWKYPSKIEWIQEGLKYFVENYKKRDIKSISFPKLGTANGKLDWEKVKNIMEKYLKDLDIDVYICLDEKNEAEGIEGKMVKDINNSTLDELVKKVAINKKQSQTIVDNLPINRFWYISKYKGIGKVSYEKLFKYYYNMTIKSDHNQEDGYNLNSYEQLSFIREK